MFWLSMEIDMSSVRACVLLSRGLSAETNPVSFLTDN